jgi:SAM-dependent methyltransferase
MPQPYTEQYFSEIIAPHAGASAGRIVPFLMELCSPTSVVDVGCGTGSWLRVFREAGVQDVLGVDGSYVDRTQLEIPQDLFLAHDLKTPLGLRRRFDLVVSLEVAEHLPPAAASTFVESLTGLGSIIVFSAAIPFQGGHGHVNEQWHDFWAAMFAERGFAAIDCLRRRFWDDPHVAWWYAQNMLLFVDRGVLVEPRCERLRREQESEAGLPRLSVVHPAKYLLAADPGHMTLGRLARTAPGVLRRSLQTHLRRALATLSPSRRRARTHVQDDASGNDSTAME